MLGLGNIALAKNHDGRMELVAMLDRRPEQDSMSVVHRWQRAADGEWTPWEPLGEPDGGSGGYGPAVARNSDGRLEVVANDMNGAAWHRWQRREGGWSNWHSFDNPPVPNMVGNLPALVYNGDGRLELFTRAQDGAVWHRWQQRPSSGWSGWHSLEYPPGHPFVGGEPAVARNKDWRLELFVEIGGVVWTRSQRADGGWSDWESLGAPEGQAAFNVAVVQNRARGVELFTSGNSRMFLRRQRHSGGWAEWVPLEGPEGNLATVGAHADGRLVLFLVDFQGALWLREQRDEGDWGEWRSFDIPVPGELLGTSAFALALNAKGQLELWFTIHETMDLYRLKQTTPNGTVWNEDRFFNKEPV
jgi:hypothetical protein